MKNTLLVLGWFVIVIFGLITVNVKHQLQLPNELLTKDMILTKHFWNTQFPYVHQQTDIILSEEIKDPNSTRKVLAALQAAEKGDVVLFHLSGYGGQVQSVYGIINNIKSSKALVVMSVEAPVYSGHAFIALSGDRLFISKNAYLMLHTTSEVDLDCSKQTGNDRGVSNIEHCLEMKNADMLIFNRFLDSMSYITTEQKMKIMSGHDVYLYAL